MIAGLRAAAYGLPFLPLPLAGSELPRVSGWRETVDPYTGQKVVAIPPLVVDWAIIHVHKADAQGNAWINGSPFEDLLLSRAARGVIITAEEIVSSDWFIDDPSRGLIPSFLVKAVVHLPRGAWPTSCYGIYDYDEELIKAYLQAAMSGEEAFAIFWREKFLTEQQS